MLEPHQDTDFLFDISKQVKEFYETVVIFVTRKDLSDPIFNALCSVRTSLRELDKHRMIDIIVDSHLQWLRAVNDIESFRNRLDPDFPREELFQAVNFTIDAMGWRLRYYQRYMEKYRVGLPSDQQSHVHADLEIVEDMHKEVAAGLQDKLSNLRNHTCFEEFKICVNDIVDELLLWLDKNYDGMVTKLTKYINVHMPHLQEDLTKTLQQIVDDLHTDLSNPRAVEMLEKLNKKGREIGTLIRYTAGHSLELSKVFEKINILEDRISRLEHEPNNAALLALKHKKEYLEKRVVSLENLKMTLKSVQNLAGVKLQGDVEEDGEICPCEDFYQLRIFNHFLPPENREKLVTELCYLWDLAVFGEKSQESMISILSAGEVKEEFTDELGAFFIDEHSRKIYKLPDSDLLYQPNERGELVPLSDDVDHIYSYDDCGRYFIDPKTRQRIYKAHATASEYIMDSSGVLLKVKEERDGIVFYYDNCGRYFINDEGKHIYRDEDRVSEYENDGLGNLVRIRSQIDIFQPCPEDAHVTEDFKYLRQTVGPALRVCIADVLLRQPADPIQHLSSSLEKYRENIELKEKRLREKEQLDEEREIIAEEERAAAERAAREALLMTQGGSEASYDSNLVMYTSMQPAEEPVSASSKV
ncbi:hypothetical protein B5X24_HaOG216454 [Helicoverpa armigera]|nr:hypothetical protein B5X24_HaOG216454 [Helicoverpa armigera]